MLYDPYRLFINKEQCASLTQALSYRDDFLFITTSKDTCNQGHRFRMPSTFRCGSSGENTMRYAFANKTARHSRIRPSFIKRSFLTRSFINHSIYEKRSFAQAGFKYCCSHSFQALAERYNAWRNNYDNFLRNPYTSWQTEYFSLLGGHA